MKCFKDNTGREWTVTVNVNAIKRVRDLTQFNLLQVVDGHAAIDALRLDPVLLVDVLYALVKPQAESLHVTDAAFGEAMVGDAIALGLDAMLEDVVHFFPKLRRDPLLAALKLTKELREKATEITLSVIAQLQSDLPPPTSTESSGATPESSGSIPAL